MSEDVSKGIRRFIMPASSQRQEYSRPLTLRLKIMNVYRMNDCSLTISPRLVKLESCVCQGSLVNAKLWQLDKILCAPSPRTLLPNSPKDRTLSPLFLPQPSSTRSRARSYPTTPSSSHFHKGIINLAFPQAKPAVKLISL